VQKTQKYTTKIGTALVELTIKPTLQNHGLQDFDISRFETSFISKKTVLTLSEERGLTPHLTPILPIKNIFDETSCIFWHN
jgi:hypothetical protein